MLCGRPLVRGLTQQVKLCQPLSPGHVLALPLPVPTVTMTKATNLHKSPSPRAFPVPPHGLGGVFGSGGDQGSCRGSRPPPWMVGADPISLLPVRCPTKT